MNYATKSNVNRSKLRSGVLAVARIARVQRIDVDEAAVERHLRKRMLEQGGMCKKLKPPMGEKGWPDRTCLWPGARCDFIELKRPKGGRFEPLQKLTHKRLRKLGFTVAVLRTKEQVDNYINATRTKIHSKGS